MEKEYPRWQTEGVKEALKSHPIVVVSGARQTGKTTLLRQIITDKSKQLAGDYRSLDDKDTRDFARSDPKGFVMKNTETMVIDEIQKAPKLIPEIKQVVDKDSRPGQYLLISSINILTLPSISDSLAGHAKYMRLRPLTVGEIRGKKPSFLKQAFDKDFPNKIEGCNKADIIALAFRGGYPEAAGIDNLQRRKSWHIDYLPAIIKRDLKDIANIRRLDILQSLFVMLASLSAKFMEATQVSAALSINKTTLDNYINTLISMFIFEKVVPWLNTDYGRIGRRAKFFVTDPGIMASVLGWNPKDVCMNNDRSSSLIETFVFQELAALVDLENKYTLSQYRDRLDKEIDFLVERDDGALLGIEVKAGHNISKDDFKPQKWFEENILKNEKPYTGIIVYSGDTIIQFEKNKLAIPTAALWT